MFTIRPLVSTDIETLAAIYCACFAEPPWYEVFLREEVIADMQGVLDWPDAIMAVAEVDGVLVGAAWLFAISRKPDVFKLAKIPETSPYISEIFVSPSARQNGIARALVADLLSRVRNETQGAVRTSLDQPSIINLFQELGWSIVATETVTSQKHINGKVAEAPDTRVILVGPVS